MDWDTIEFFSQHEFACPGESKPEMDLDFVTMLDQARKIAGVPFKITSGFRTPEHNRKVGGSRNSAHLRGMAADISCRSSGHRRRIVGALVEAGFQRIGISHNFVHADLDLSLPAPVMWLY